MDDLLRDVSGRAEWNLRWTERVMHDMTLYTASSVRDAGEWLMVNRTYTGGIIWGRQE